MSSAFVSAPLPQRTVASQRAPISMRQVSPPTPPLLLAALAAALAVLPSRAAVAVPFDAASVAPAAPTALAPAGHTRQPDSLVRVIPSPVRVRPSLLPPRIARPLQRRAALGLVGFSALTSGSFLFRSARARARADAHDARVRRDDPDLSAVVSMHIPFCVPERLDMLQALHTLADTANVRTSHGMADAARRAAQLLLNEARLMEDSRKFAPKLDFFLTEDLESAEKRFSAHVQIEAERFRRVNTSEELNGPRAVPGAYGVVTLVLATAKGVDLRCSDPDESTVGRLRRALHRICNLRNGQVVGLELKWIPAHGQNRYLTRSQLCEVFPWLKLD